MSKHSGKWCFWIDRGGTFTDIVAQSREGQLLTHKLLSENPGRYEDAALQGIRDVLGLASGQPIPAGLISSIKMGTTVATNALLERRGENTLFVTTRGFADVLRIGYQNRPDLFARHVVLPGMLYSSVVEVDERIDANGNIVQPLDENHARIVLQSAFDQGIRSVAITLMHGFRYPQHEKRLYQLALETGFQQVSTGHVCSPLMKIVSRADTTVVDAYLSPILRRYVDKIASYPGIAGADDESPELMFMQSNGGLTHAHRFQGKDAILSGPAGGVVGMVKTAAIAGHEQLIGVSRQKIWDTKV